MDRRPLLTWILALLAGCNVSDPPTARAPMPVSASGPTSNARLAELRRLVQRSTTLGGHGPIPQRGVSAASLQAVDRELQQADLPLLVDLLGDDDAVVRLVATHLLSRHDPAAADHVRVRLTNAPEGLFKRRLQDALIEINLPQSPP